MGPGPGPALRPAPRVVFTGRLHPQKNLDTLLDAWPAVVRQTGADLILVGQGPDRERLEARAGSLGVAEHVRFAGALADPADILRTASVFVLPSIAEGMSNSLLEAMATALPVPRLSDRREYRPARRGPDRPPPPPRRTGGLVVRPDPGPRRPRIRPPPRRIGSAEDRGRIRPARGHRSLSRPVPQAPLGGLAGMSPGSSVDDGRSGGVIWKGRAPVPRPPRTPPGDRHERSSIE